MSTLDQSIANLGAAKQRYGNIQVRELLIESAFSGISVARLCHGLQTAYPELKPNLYRRILYLNRHELDELIAEALDGITDLDVAVALFGGAEIGD